MNKLIERLRGMDQKRLETIYQNVFNTDEGQLVLEDLKGRFFEYAPVRDMTQAGAQAVLIHIKNMVNPIGGEDGPGSELHNDMAN